MFGPIEITTGESASIMGGQADFHPVVHIAPLRMMIETLAHQGHASHETKRLRKIHKAEFTLYGPTLIDEFPGGQ